MKKRALSLLVALSVVLSLMTPLISVYASGGTENASDGTSDVELPKTLINGNNNEGRTLNFNQGWKFKAEFTPEAVDPDYSLIELQKWENVDLPHTVRVEKYSSSGAGGIYMGDAMYIKHFPVSADNEGKQIYIRFEGVMGVTDVWVNGVKQTTYLASETGDATMYGGYLPFVINVTDVLVCDGVSENVIVVHADSRVDPTVPPGKDANALDFSYFGGIYRDVTMTITDGVHITDANYENIVGGGGVLVDYPNVSADNADVYVKTHVRNDYGADKSVSLKTEIIDADGIVVASETIPAQNISAGSDHSFEQTIMVSEPKLWDLDDPYLHDLVSTVYVDGVPVDTVTTRIGIRKIEMHRDYGLKINGVVQDMLNGVNRHQEYAYIGYAASDSLQRKDAMKFKEAGINVVRTAHYPASPEFLDACDELGILIIEPTPGWQWYNSDPVFAARVKNDIRQMVRRDRNHPCILAFETVLNETSVPAGFTISLAEVAKEEHPSAKVATEDSVPEGQKDTVSDIMYKNPERSDFAVGFTREYGDSYREQQSPDNFFFRRAFRGTGMDYAYYPGGEGAMFLQAVKRLMGNQNDTPYYCAVDAASGAIGGASGSSRSYLNVAENYVKGQQSGNVAYIGATSWIGIDHNRTYASDISACGLWDLLRLPKFSYYAMASQRSVEEDSRLTELGIDNGPIVFISGYWTEKAPVVDKTNESFTTIGTDSSRIILVYSNTERVKLSVVGEDGDVLWEKTESPMTGKNREYINAPFQFLNVPYTSGSHLVAIGYDAEGTELARHEVYTAGTPAKVTLSADTMGIDLVADGSDTVMIYGYIVDENGVICNDAYNEMKFTVVSGDAEIVGDGNARVGANPVNAEAGIFGVYLRAGTEAGDIVIRVESDGLESSEITIRSVEMTEPVNPYYLIAYTGTGDEASLSDYLSNMPYSSSVNVNSMLSKVSVGNVSVGDEVYKNSITVMNTSDIFYDIGGVYNNISGAVMVSESGNEDASAIFKIYVDGRLVYKSDIVERGDIFPFDVDIPNGERIELRVTGLGRDYRNYAQYVWLSPYLTEGEAEIDESELYENIALGKPAEASSCEAGSDPAYAVDGNALNTWVGSLVGEGDSADPQYLVVDLLEKTDIRGVRVGVLNDSITYKYDILVSEDKSVWTLVKSVAKTGQANGIEDEFKAEGVRYVKILFTEIGTDEDRGQYSNATITELEVFRDPGVDSVLEYDLKNLGIDGKDIVFDPYVKNYTVELEGYETELRVYAEAFDPNADISINGTAANDGRVTISALPKDGVITVSVVSASGKGATEYRINIEGELGNIFYDNAMNTMDDYKNGETRWLYQRYDVSSGRFVDIEGSWIYSNNQPYFGVEDPKFTWARMGALFAHPGSGDIKVSRTYVAPKSGTAEIELWATKLYDASTGNIQNGSVGFSILKNGEKVWPASSDHELLSGVLDLTLTVELEEGDHLQFVIDNWDGNNGQDATYMDTTVHYMSDAEIACDGFLARHADILAKTDVTVSISDKDAINSALSDMATLSLGARRLLVEERRQLENMLDIVNILENGHVTAYGIEKFVKTISVNDTIELPKSAKLYMSDGSVQTVDINWDSYDPSLFAEPGTYRIEGKVDSYPAGTYFLVIVSNEDMSGGDNIAENTESAGLPMAFSSYSNISSGGDGGDYVHLVNDGSTSSGNWTTYNSKNPTEWLGMIFGSGENIETKTIDQISLTMPQITTYATQVPNLIKIQYYTGPAISSLPTTPDDMLGSSHPLANDANWTDAETLLPIDEYVFASLTTTTIDIEPVTSVAVRIVMSPNKRPSGGDGCIGVVEMTCIEAMKHGDSTPDVSEILIDGESLPGFSASVTDYTYTVNGDTVPDIDVTVNDNSVFTVVKPLNTSGTVKVIVTAEDGLTTVTYNILLDDSAAFYLEVEKEFVSEDIENAFSEYKESDYRAAEWQALEALFEKALADVSALTDINEVKAFDLAAVIAEADDIKTDAEYKAEELSDAKAEKIAEINAELAKYDEADYRAAEWQALEALFAKAISDISVLTDISEVTAFDVAAVKAEADEVLTETEAVAAELAAAKTAKIAEINAELAKYDEADYRAAEWQALEALFAKAIADVNALTDINEVMAFDVAAVKAEADEIKTDAELSAEETPGGSDPGGDDNSPADPTDEAPDGGKVWIWVTVGCIGVAVIAGAAVFIKKKCL